MSAWRDFARSSLEDGTVNRHAGEDDASAGFEFTVTFIDPWTPRDQQTIANHGGMLIHAGGEDFWFAGQGITITFKGAADGPPLVGIDLAEEGGFDAQGKWQPGRRLNGDQTHQGRHIRLPPGKPQIQRVRLYRYR